MVSPAVRGTHRFHEIPLVIFTALGIAGAGIGAGELFLGGWGGSLPLLPRSEALPMVVLLGLGAVFSTGHLGRPLRGPLAIRGLGRSALSNEVVLLGVTLLGGVLVLTVPSESLLAWFPHLLASVGSVFLLFSIGSVYRISGQLSWGGPAILQPMVLGLCWGLLFIGLNPGPGDETPIRPAILGFVLADALLFIFRLVSMEGLRRRGTPVHARIFRSRWTVLGTRLLLSGVATPFALLAGRPWIALMALSLALVVDRFAFYALAIRRTTESEVSRIEALL